MKKLLLGAAAIAVVGAVPQIAAAHDFTVACNNGQLVVTPDFQQFNPTYVIGDRTVTVTWTDGFTRTRPLPPPCPTPETPTTPTTPEVVPPPPVVVTPPPPVEPLPPKKPTTPGKKKPRKPFQIKKTYRDICIVGQRQRTVITVTLSNGKVGTVTRYGRICRLLPVTG